ncbi:hypothetical protein Dtox_2535 [Desulfofarcimen acetoxidans DSM 771]|jgi:hypothetical protein|uniref:Uncharacterized protein n=1 Tax=Desulfofarcimen acetoxidans (strain ATCC 49208 / DSM 771 / KCTC 5769 / VKM B-1644 / 5575) TaxID=485916 RepID=C8W0T2_DESAS|nr:hypothetical protein [Desulfofarcimen acetoxidans]ACV63337.1 hypothetical protein Dtox_2535 [Desulfofarcimen acetoxidans DSM 771]
MNQNCSIACCKFTFSEEEKNHYTQLRNKIFNDLIRTEELADGYSFIFSVSERDFLHDLADWIPLEKKCCPFLQFSVLINQDEYVRLQLTGPSEVKNFLLNELELN